MSAAAWYQHQPMTAADWRGFRVYLRDLNDQQFEDVDADLHLESLARAARDCNITRLFFTSMTDEELRGAQHFIAEERAARLQDQATAARWAKAGGAV